MRSVATFLMFSDEQHGKAEEALRLYTSIVSDSEILSIERYGAEEMGPEGTVKLARFRLNGTDVMAVDSPIAHGFTFTPSTSFFVECETESELDHAFETLLKGGEALMPLDNYGFSRRFGWVKDKYGVSWQLNLA